MECFVCDRIQQIKEGFNPYFVKEYETGYAVIADFQYYRGTTIFLCKEDKEELFQLEPSFKKKFLEEMSIVAEGVFKAFHPKKLNYELLGNSEAHMHWWLIPRYEDDEEPKLPVWYGNPKERFNEQEKPSETTLAVRN